MLDFIFIYLQLYIPISIILFMINLLLMPYLPLRNPFDVFNDLNNYINEIRKTNEVMADNMELLVNVMIENKAIAYMVIFIFYLIPLLRFMLIISLIQDCFGDEK